jgi:NAD(P)-dependent dehydrogenase (short-subunit alcohol dehydrogenase family)
MMGVFGVLFFICDWRIRMSVCELLSLKGKKALVTGGSRGLGYAVAEAFAECGADVAITGRCRETVREAAESIAARYNARVIGLQGDVSRLDDVKKVVESVTETFGTLDIAFNNAGVSGGDEVLDITGEELDRIMDINVKGVLYCCQEEARVMLAKGRGSIINMASMSATIINIPVHVAHYCASKAAVKSLTKGMAVEWAEQGVRVNCISPGFFDTEMNRKREDLYDTFRSLIPMKRIASPDELKGILVYLASDASSYMTGSDIIIDGGYTCV